MKIHLNKKTYVIGDIAGNYTSLVKLISSFDHPCDIVLVGDLVDRGNQSKEVIEHCMANPDYVVLKGNHEDLMVDCLEGTNRYESWDGKHCWEHNGGFETIQSFSGQKVASRDNIPREVIEWAKALPEFHIVELEGKKYHISHAPPPAPGRIINWPDEPPLLWNRKRPVRNSEYELQIFGHNWKHIWYEDKDGKYAVCIDDSRNQRLTAIELPTLNILHSPWKD